jgi:NAD(P)-binding Rossmann-like domain
MKTISHVNALRLLGNPSVVPNEIDPGTALLGWIQDKDYDQGAIKELSRQGILKDFMSSFITAGRDEVPWNFIGARLLSSSISPSLFLHSYRGEIPDDILFQQANSLFSSTQRFIGQGAATSTDSFSYGEYDNSGVPIAIIGTGAAGLMAARTLARIGFSNITLFENKDNRFGIWSNENVFRGSRNNPRKFSFFGNDLEAAPGNGDSVRRFLSRIADDITYDFTVIEETVTAVIPGDLNHKIVTTVDERTFPIVINAMGLGKPRTLNDKSRMTIYPDTEVKGATRWQKTNLEAKTTQGKRYIFIGLGNSTAEMIQQLHALEDQGYDIDYRILTHYPLEAIMNPYDTVMTKKGSFRMFRDLTKPDLTSFQGDLEQSRNDYFRALLRGRIISDVTMWGCHQDGANKKVGYTQNGEQHEIEYDKLMVLTGYEHTALSVEPFGCKFCSKTKAVHYDYDGEIVATPGANEGRLHKGYFALGAITDAPHNRNAVVIPGIISSIPALAGGVVMRAHEYRRKQNN